ncbi:MAG TPA: putative collagen-binding domain-containing protein, partial [Baekduia sp.]|nr:putative collagen-binding domain-containing protein [Baekduia sp.]
EAVAGRNDPNGSNPDPYWDTIRDALGRTRIYAGKLNLERAVPSGGLSSTGYCLADPGNQYLVYQPSSGAFTLAVTAATYHYEWFNPSNGTVAGSGTIALGTETHSFTPPFSGDAVLLLSR